MNVNYTARDTDLNFLMNYEYIVVLIINSNNHSYTFVVKLK